MSAVLLRVRHRALLLDNWIAWEIVKHGSALLGKAERHARATFDRLAEFELQHLYRFKEEA